MLEQETFFLKTHVCREAGARRRKGTEHLLPLKSMGKGGGKIVLLILSTDRNFSHFLLVFDPL